MMISSSRFARLRPTQLLHSCVSSASCLHRSEIRHGSPWAVRERVVGLLDEVLVLLEPAFGAERLRVLAPHLWVAVDRVRRYAEHGALGEESAADGDASLGDHPWQADARRRVDAERFVDDGLEVGQTLDLLEARDGVVLGERVVELLLQLALDVGVLGEVVGDRARRAAGRVRGKT